MKAALCQRYGTPDVVRVGDTPTPRPGGDQILVRVHAAVVSSADVVARRGIPRYTRAVFGLRRPRRPVLGSDFAGRVEAIGPDVTRFAVGDDVFGTTGAVFGAHADYVCLSEQAAVITKPVNLSYAESAAVVDGTALCFLWHKANLRSGQAVLINGASGAVGTSAVQYARHVGARVTAVCGGANADLVRRLGADTVIDHTAADFTRSGEKYDVVFDIMATASFARCRRIIAAGGTYLTTSPGPSMLRRSRSRHRTVVVAFAGLRPPAEKRADLEYLRERAEDSTFVPVIETCYPLADIAAAHRHVDSGHKKGNVVINMIDGGR